MSGNGSGDNPANNKPALPTIITTQDATPLADDSQQFQLNTSAEPTSQTVSPSNSGVEPISPSGSLGSVPNIAISTTAPVARSSAAAAASHGRNYSISSLGHGRTPSLGSAAAHLQVPQSPSQGTVSLAAPGAPAHHTVIPPSPTLSVISDDNSPTASTARTHNRLPSVSSSAGFSSDPGHGPGMGSHARGKVDKLHSDDGSAKGPRRPGQDDDNDDDCADEIDHPAKGIKGLKKRLYAHTRAGRIKAQEAKMAEERRQAREMDPTPFRHRPYEFADLVDPKSPKLLKELGGTAGLVARLGSDANSGLNLAMAASPAGAESEKVQDVERGEKDPENVPVQQREDYVNATQEDRERVYGKNALPERQGKSLLLLMWLAFQDKILILLTVAAVVSLALGLYTDFGAATEYVSCDNPPPGLPGCPAPKVDWVEGVAIIVAIMIVDLVGSLNDYQKERQFAKLNAKKEERNVKVIRQGKQALMNVHDVLVGDVLMLEPGEIIPCDGVFLRGHNVKCDESGATGESDMIRKIPFEECYAAWEEAEAEGGKHPSKDCFLISGSRVLEGYGEYIVIAVGPNSFNGKLMLSLRSDAESTPLQAKLNNLAGLIALLGAAAGALLFLALMIRFFVQLKTIPGRTSDQKAQSFIQILVISVTVIVVAVPEGLPLAITLALAFATKRMTKANLLVRLLGSCETMANATVVCTDKTGTLTQNEMHVVAGSIGVDLQFADILNENQGRVNEGGWSIDQKDINDYVQGPFQALFNDSIAVNSTAFEEEAQEEDDTDAASIINKLGPLAKLFRRKKKSATAEVKVVGFVGSKTETALLNLAKKLGWEHYKTSRERAEIVQMIPFSSERKAMGVVVKLREGGYRLYLKGASEVLTRACATYVDIPREGGDAASRAIQTKHFDQDATSKTEATINLLANQSLRTIAICYRDFAQWPPAGASMVADAGAPEVDYSFLSKDLTLIAITGIEDPLRPGVRDAVEACRQAGVQIKMCTGDNVLTAKSIAKQCGILSEGGIVMEGPVFRKLSEAEMTEIAPKLQVLARSSPEDKKILVEKLKSLGEVVGVTGDGTNDGPALKTANVGFSMGIAGTEVAKEASDIILMDDNFASIVSAIMWGRCVNDAVRKFLQFQLSVNVVAVIVTFITAVASEEEQSILTAVQLLWLNIIMDTFAALALATDPATPKLLNRKPDRRNAPLISTDMWKMIVGQSIYQIIVVLVLNFAGKHILGLEGGDEAAERQHEVYMSALIFNVFVWCQLFNQLNCRRLDRKFNIFEDLHKNIWFLLIVAVECGAQVLIIFVGGAAFSATPLDGRGWGISLIAGLISWPLAIVIRLIPTEPIERFLIKHKLMSDPNALPLISPEAVEEALNNPDSEAAREIALANSRLVAYSRIRGGRVRSQTLNIIPGRSKKRDPEATPQTIMALVPAMIASAVSMAGSNEPPASDYNKAASTAPSSS